MRHKYCGSSDPRLSEKGNDCCNRAAEFLKDVRFDHVWVSPKKRTIETVQIVRKKNIAGFEIAEEPKLLEMDFGEFEGLSYRQISGKFPGEWEKYMNDWTQYTFPGGNNVQEYYKKTSAYMDHLRREYSGNILLVTHAGFIRAALAEAQYKDVSRMFDFDVPPGSLHVLEINSEKVTWSRRV